MATYSDSKTVRKLAKNIDTQASTHPVKLGTLLRSIAIEAGCLTENESRIFDKVRDKTPADPMQFDPE
jgi:hypothetical protein